MTKVICGFPGVGKSTLYRELKEQGVQILDSDSSTFDKASFPENYLTHIEMARLAGFTVLVSTHREVREGLHARNIPFILARPASTDQKQEYLQRYEDRGSPPEFVQLMDRMWDTFYDDVAKDFKAEHWLVQPGEYLNEITPYLQRSMSGK